MTTGLSTATQSETTSPYLMSMTCLWTVGRERFSERWTWPTPFSKHESTQQHSPHHHANTMGTLWMDCYVSRWMQCPSNTPAPNDQCTLWEQFVMCTLTTSSSGHKPWRSIVTSHSNSQPHLGLTFSHGFHMTPTPTRPASYFYFCYCHSILVIVTLKHFSLYFIWFACLLFIRLWMVPDARTCCWRGFCAPNARRTRSSCHSKWGEYKWGICVRNAWKSS